MTTTSNITDGPIIRTILHLATPAVLGMFMESALSLTDFFWVGKLGPSAQDAVTTAMVVIWTIFSAISLISVGVTALVARYIGAGRPDVSAHFARQGLFMATAVGALFTAIGLVFTPQFLAFMDVSAETGKAAAPYLRVFFVTSTLYFVMETIFAIFRAAGDTRTPTMIGIGYVALNMILDPILIFGWGPIPAYGVTGAGLATAISVLCGTVVAGYLIRGRRLGFPLEFTVKVRPVIKDILKIGRIGLPIAVQQLVFVVVYWFLIKIVHVFGAAAGAGMGIGNRMESLSYLMCYGFSIAASTMVGQNLGAGKPDRAARCAWGAVGVSGIVTAFISVLFLVFPEYIASIFTDDARVKEIAVDYLIILGLSQTAMAVEIVLEGAFGGAGDTVPPMVVQIPGAVVRIPLAYWLAFNLDLGINGVWWTLTITSVIKAIVLIVWFRRGAWKKKKV